MRLRPSTQRNSQSASSSAEVRPLGPHAPTFLALVVEERRSVVPHVEAHPPHRSVAFRARCRLPHPDEMTGRRRLLLVAALGFVLLERWQSVRELIMLHAWLDSWAGLGAIVVEMQRHGYDLALTGYPRGWRATFLHGSHVLHPWVGQVLHWWPTPWRAVQEGA